MPLAEIKNEIERNAEREAESIRSAAQKEKEQIINEAKARAKQISEEHEKEAEREIKSLEQEFGASIELEGERIYLDAREVALKREASAVRIELIERIKNDGALYKRIFTNAVSEASSIAPLRDFAITMNREDSKLLEKSGARIEYQRLEDGGLIVQSYDKSVRIDATIGTIVDSRNDEIKSSILEYLFSEMGAGKERKSDRMSKKRGSAGKPKRHQKVHKRKRVKR